MRCAERSTQHVRHHRLIWTDEFNGTQVATIGDHRCQCVWATAAWMGSHTLGRDLMPQTTPPSHDPSPTRSVTAELKDDGADASPLLASEMRRVHDRLGR